MSSAASHGQVIYQSDFESDDGKLIVTLGASWEHGVPTSGPGIAHSGTQCWATNLAGPPDASSQRLALPVLDASGAVGADGIIVSWWQYFDEPPIISQPFPDYQAFVSVFSDTAGQDLFGREYSSTSTDLSHVGWRKVEVLLGPEYLTPNLSISIRFQGSNVDGMYLDDITVEAVGLTTVSTDDFESGPGGFTGTWQHGTQSGCPLPVVAPSGVNVWSTGITSCSYSDGEELLSPAIDLTPFAGHFAVFASWNRYSQMENLADGVHHELSYDGGPWELGADYQAAANGNGAIFGWTGYGVALDPARGSSCHQDQNSGRSTRRRLLGSL